MSREAQSVHEHAHAERKARRSRWRGILYVSLAALLWSTAGIWVRYLTLDIWTIQCGRAFFGAFSLFIYVAVTHRTNIIEPFVTIPLAGYVIVPINTIGMMAYMQALNWTTVANVMIVYTTLPFVVALLGWLWIRERVAMRTMFASAIALSGVMFMVGGSFQAGNVKGDLASFVMVLSFAALVILARRHPKMSMPAHSILSGLLCAAAAWPLATLSSITWHDLILLAVLGSITIGVANVLYMRGVARIPAAEAGLIGLLDTVIAPFWVFMIFNERPAEGALIGGAIVLAAVVYQILGERRPVLD
jgi:drug/metabolite transporter (DMT)-like permease